MITTPMTIHHAKERVARIWGGNRIVCVTRRVDYGFDVHLLPAGIASDVRERNYSYHRLDREGRVICHDDCGTLAEARVPPS